MPAAETKQVCFSYCRVCFFSETDRKDRDRNTYTQKEEETETKRQKQRETRKEAGRHTDGQIYVQNPQARLKRQKQNRCASPAVEFVSFLRQTGEDRDRNRYTEKEEETETKRQRQKEKGTEIKRQTDG